MRHLLNDIDVRLKILENRPVENPLQQLYTVPITMAVFEDLERRIEILENSKKINANKYTFPCVTEQEKKDLYARVEMIDDRLKKEENFGKNNNTNYAWLYGKVKTLEYQVGIQKEAEADSRALSVEIRHLRCRIAELEKEVGI